MLQCSGQIRALFVSLCANNERGEKLICKDTLPSHHTCCCFWVLHQTRSWLSKKKISTRNCHMKQISSNTNVKWIVVKGSFEYLMNLSAQFVQELIPVRGVRIRKAKLPVFDIEELENVRYWNILCPDWKVFVISDKFWQKLKPKSQVTKCRPNIRPHVFLFQFPAVETAGDDGSGDGVVPRLSLHHRLHRHPHPGGPSDGQAEWGTWGPRLRWRIIILLTSAYAIKTP